MGDNLRFVNVYDIERFTMRALRKALELLIGKPIALLLNPWDQNGLIQPSAGKGCAQSSEWPKTGANFRAVCVRYPWGDARWILEEGRLGCRINRDPAPSSDCEPGIREIRWQGDFVRALSQSHYGGAGPHETRNIGDRNVDLGFPLKVDGDFREDRGIALIRDASNGDSLHRGTNSYRQITETPAGV
jgi:hypothetical protein